MSEVSSDLKLYLEDKKNKNISLDDELILNELSYIFDKRQIYNGFEMIIPVSFFEMRKMV